MRRLRFCEPFILLTWIGLVLPGCCAHHGGVLEPYGCSSGGCGTATASQGCSSGCAPGAALLGPVSGPVPVDAIPPPGISRFHPVPTRPVFSPR